jgi:hypothetical protein
MPKKRHRAEEPPRMANEYVVIQSRPKLKQGHAIWRLSNLSSGHSRSSEREPENRAV